MRLKSIKYSEFEGTPKEWILNDFSFEAINLVVGKNATGKTRSLNVINAIGKILSGRRKPSELITGCYDVVFEHDDETLNYVLRIKDHKVISEIFCVAGQTRLIRAEDGKGEIFHEKEGKMLEFQTPDSEAAVVARRDSIQHDFLRPLSEWGSGVRHYAFGEAMGRNNLTILSDSANPPDPSNAEEVIGLFIKANKHYPDIFKKKVIHLMKQIGYDLEDINVEPPSNFSFSPNPFMAGTPVVLVAKEKSLSAPTDQFNMSQGMFRALSVIINIQYAIIEDTPSCVIIDDIGEGLDFDRSCRLIEEIRACSLSSNIQLIMSTNDKFVMNNVPICEWSVLVRDGGHIAVKNQRNSSEFFDAFKFTGLNNFDFLALDFINDQEAVESILIDIDSSEGLNL
jgi:energy-coupling factor transporter ATP-binding protein EcfA2